MPPFDPSQPNPMVNSIMAILNTFVKTVKSWPEYGKVYGPIMDKWDGSRMMTSFMDVCKPMRSGFTVLNHADLWINNFLFQYDEKKNPTECIFIDFQGTFWGSPANDLL